MEALSPDILRSNILIVDDESAIVTILRRLLGAYGFKHVVTALNGEQGLNIIRNAETPFVVVLSDQHMPGMNGYEFFEKVAVESPHSRRLLITGYRDFKGAIDAINKGGIHKYITKPWDEAQLLKIISDESLVYHRIQERKRLHTITKNQNARIYQLARHMASKKEEFKQRLASKKALLKFLKSVQARCEQDTDIEAHALDLFFSDNSVQGQMQLLKAFEVIDEQVNTILGSIAGKYHLSFDKNTENRSEKIHESAAYHVIDLIIGNAVQRARPMLMQLCRCFDTDLKIEAYKRVPDIWELAYYGGFISAEEIDDFRGVHYTALLTANKISRVHLSRLVIMRQFIQVRLADETRSLELVRRKIVSPVDLDILFAEQVRRFLEKKTLNSIGDLLFENGIIDASTRDSLFDNAPKPSPVQTDLEPGALTASAEPKAPFELVVSKEGTTAWIRNLQTITPGVGKEHVKQLLKSQGVIHGLVLDEQIDQQLASITAAGEKWVVAQGIPAKPGRHPEIQYCFKTAYQRPGIFREDGTIDFMERGDIPFVGKGDLLAKITPGENGTAGCNVFGAAVEPDPIQEKVLVPGGGTRLSEDGLALYATVGGEPSLDDDGTICVYEELLVKKDVDFQTGHIDFNGNVFVLGSIKEGFRVNCVSLTVSEVNGGIITTKGDVNVSKGIVNARVTALGNITAKYINNSTLRSLGDVIVTREIMGAKIIANGELHNKEGRITASVVSARMGMALYRVGTEKSEASVLKAGSEEYFDTALAEFARREKETRTEMDALAAQIKKAEMQNLKLHKRVTDYSHGCEIHKARLREVEKGPQTGIQSDLAAQIKGMEREIRNIFDTQDLLMQQTDSDRAELEKLKERLDSILAEKEKMVQLMENQKPAVPVVRVLKQITAGTKVAGPGASMVMRRDEGACRILEITSAYTDTTPSKEMVIHNL